MAISQTTFEERLARINNAQTGGVAAKISGKKQRRPLRARCLTFPFFVGLGILTGGAAYAFVSSQQEIQWVIALAG
ncbi:hypothetical protein OS190_14620 [Sulfitobacter sp. F26204]|uniref:hypothetical protein n=1 Tax=Sulfitobacter sp. F26204 TaxID=2996014 RepID=UPI00225E2214|nr:hypothetical protein [Sulfitobacter sp. F26204]MCX7560808.1 hypothetical protein [Sulfitobacter sp. F26204]